MANNRKKEMQVVELNGMAMDYELRISARTKHIRCSVTAEGSLVVSVPDHFPLKRLEEVIKGKQDWILNHVQKAKDRSERLPEREFVSGKILPCLGRNYVLEIEENQSDQISVWLDKTVLRMSVPAFLAGDAGKREIVKILELWYAREARKVIPQRVAEINKGFGFAYNRIAIRNQRTRWGSCSQSKNLNFNWRLLLAPPEILDYVIVHELAHLQELNHSRHFWRLVESRCSYFREARKWLKENGHALSI